ncbi:MAG: cation diffusion facilitator family transporter [Faecousia sp.]
MKLLYSLFRQDPDSREGVILTTSGLGVIVNILCSVLKIVIGLAVSSIAVVSEGLNNAADAASSLLTIVGTKLAGKHPTEKHPFGYGRVEYLTSLIIAGLILYTGIEAFTGAVDGILHPYEMELSFLITGIIAFSAVIKLFLGTYMIREGKRIDSGSLVAVGKECRADCIVSAMTILATLVYLLFDLSLDAYAAVITSLFIIKAGAEVLKDTVSELLGRPGDKELAQELYRVIREDPMVLNAADMMLHNYGPDAYSGSVNIEIDCGKTVEEVYSNIHALQLRIMHAYHVTMVFGIYAVNNDRETLKKLRGYIAQFVREHEHIKSYHALYIDPKNNDIYCDLVVDYSLRDWDALEAEFRAYMHERYPENRLEVVIETEYV